MTSLRLLAVLDVRSSTPARAKRLAPRPDGPLTHFASPRGEICRLVFPPPACGSYKRETAGPVSTPLDQEDVSGQRALPIRSCKAGVKQLLLRFNRPQLTAPQPCTSFKCWLKQKPKAGMKACISHHLTSEARDKTAMTSLRLLAVLDVGSSTPARAERLAPRPDGPLTHFASPRGEKCRLVREIGGRRTPWRR